MKRILFVFLCVISIVSLLVLPSFASVVYSAHFVDDHFVSFSSYNSPFPPGEYNISFYVTGLDASFDMGTHELILEPFVSSEPDFPYQDCVQMFFWYMNEDGLELTFDFVWGLYEGEYSFIDDGNFTSYAGAFYDGTEYFDVIVELTPIIADGDKVPFMSALSEGMPFVITWVSVVVSAFVSSQGALNGLLPLFAVVIAIPALFFGIKAVRRFIWGA